MSYYAMLASVLRPDVHITDNVRDKLERIDEHDFEPLRMGIRWSLRQSGHDPTDEWLNACILALKMYYAILIIDNGNVHVPDTRVDLVWRAHTIIARDYENFCWKVFGRLVLYSAYELERNNERMREYTRKCYVHHFTFIDSRLHPPARDTDFAV